MHSLTLQRLGQTMETGRIERWLKAEGETFEAGDPLYEVETDKVTVEVEAHDGGTIVRILVDPSDEVDVGVPLAVVVQPGEEWTAEGVDAFLQGIELADGVATGESVAPAASDVTVSPGAEEPRVAVIPRARTLARELGVDLAGVKGSGDDGAITVADVQSAAAAATPSSTGARVRERSPLGATSRRMAALMSQSWQTIPQFVQHVEVSADRLVARRQTERDAGETSAVTIGDLLLSAFLRGATEVSTVNASLIDGDLVVYDDVNVALAVATDSGLHVPVIHRAQELALVDLAAAAHALADKARLGQLELVDVEGATITFSNLGAAGIDLGTPLVTAPQAAILFVGALRRIPELREGQLVEGSRVWLSGAFDHRIVDGAEAARFMGAVKTAIESL
jgi:pyruvate dehydrogenase E2 component (dihydrolipoamide acetyltransferase)